MIHEACVQILFIAYYQRFGGFYSKSFFLPFCSSKRVAAVEVAKVSICVSMCFGNWNKPRYIYVT